VAEWQGRTTAKQRLTAARIHRQLLSEGYTVSDRSVRQYVRQKRLQSAEVFVPLSYRPGELAEVDFLTWWSQSRASSGMPGSSSCT
jgi:hypothetical protein